MPTDATKLVVINESRSAELRGDVLIYADFSQASRSLEAIDVVNGEYFGFLGDGTVLRLLVEDGKVRIVVDPSVPKNASLVRKLLEEMAGLIPENSLAKRGLRRPLGPICNLSLNALVEIIGLEEA